MFEQLVKNYLAIRPEFWMGWVCGMFTSLTINVVGLWL